MSTTSRRQLELGRVVVTANCLGTLARLMAEKQPRVRKLKPEQQELLAQLLLQRSLNRHMRHDWGELDGEDVQANREALLSGARILSVYHVLGEKIYVITDAVTDVCPACWAGEGTCEPEKGEWHGSDEVRMHFRTDVAPRRVSTTVMLPEDY